MTRETQLEIIGYLVATSGTERSIYVPATEKSYTTRSMTVPVPVVCEDDAYTEVEVYPDGHIEIYGWDENGSLGDDASAFSDEAIDKIFNAFYGMV